MKDGLFSRQAAIDVIEKHIDILDAIDENYLDGLKLAMCLLKALPLTEPERKKGRFIGIEYDGYADGVYYEWKCSCCGAIFENDEPTYNFCPNCGADMRGDE